MPDGDRTARRRWRDTWQLHIPLVLVLALCTFLTIVEARRATEGVWRAWVYMFEWPLIALFTIWIWNRYRTQGSIFKAMQDRWRQRIDDLAAEQSAAEQVAKQSADAAEDPDLRAWRDYVARLDDGREPRDG